MSSISVRSVAESKHLCYGILYMLETLQTVSCGWGVEESTVAYGDHIGRGVFMFCFSIKILFVTKGLLELMIRKKPLI